MLTIKGIMRMIRLKEQTEGATHGVAAGRPPEKDQGGASIPIYPEPVTVKFHYEELPNGQLELIQDLPESR